MTVVLLSDERRQIKFARALQRDRGHVQRVVVGFKRQTFASTKVLKPLSFYKMLYFGTELLHGSFYLFHFNFILDTLNPATNTSTSLGFVWRVCIENCVISDTPRRFLSTHFY